MKTALSANYTNRRLTSVRFAPQTSTKLSQKQRVKAMLKGLGVSYVGMHMLESRWLPDVLFEDEQIAGITYGHSSEGNAMLVATDKRVLFLDRKPLFSKKDEISFNVISGVSVTTAGMDSIVTLHTRIKDYAIRSFNNKCSDGFVAHIENYCLPQRSYTV